MRIVLRITYTLTVVVLPLLLCWMYLNQVSGEAFVAVVVLWVAATLVRDFASSTVRWREYLMREDAWDVAYKLFPKETRAALDAEREERMMLDED